MRLVRSNTVARESGFHEAMLNTVLRKIQAPMIDCKRLTYCLVIRALLDHIISLIVTLARLNLLQKPEPPPHEAEVKNLDFHRRRFLPSQLMNRVLLPIFGSKTTLLPRYGTTSS